MPFDNTNAALPRDARILFRAADIVSRGHCKNSLFGSVDGDLFIPVEQVTQACVMGAIRLSLAIEDGEPLVERIAGDQDNKVTRKLFDLTNGRGAYLVDFNNRRSTTREMVVDELRKMAAAKMEMADAS